MAKKEKVTDNAVIEILESIASGGNYSETMAAIVSKWRMSERTFDRRWKKAKEQHQEAQEARRMKLADSVAKADEEAVKRGVIERTERLEILTSIARGEAQAQITPGETPIEQRTKYVFPNQSERQKAIDQLTRMGEGYSPVKKDFQIDSTRDFEINIVD